LDDAEVLMIGSGNEAEVLMIGAGSFRVVVLTRQEAFQADEDAAGTPHPNTSGVDMLC